MTWKRTFNILLDHFGPQRWWPGDTPFEVMVGAILTQNTAWANVEHAIAALKNIDELSVPAILHMEDAALAVLIRPAGYFNVKARRLKALCRFLDAAGVAQTPERLTELGSPAELRARLLEIHGVGEETADSILLYAFNLPTFVVDTYTRRIFSRLGLINAADRYADIQARFHKELPTDCALFNEYHALIVTLGKHLCRPKPDCPTCPLLAICPYPKNESVSLR